MVYDNDMPELLDESELPLLLPDVEEYKPGGQARSPLAALTDWVNLPDGKVRETDTMPDMPVPAGTFCGICRRNTMTVS